VFDLGLKPSQRGMLAADFPWCEWRSLDFGTLPAHVVPARGSYAWKPLVVHATAAEFGGLVLWLDSACLFQDSLDEFLAALLQHGVYTLEGQSSLGEHCAPTIREILGAPPEMLDKAERVSGIVGIDTSKSVARELLQEWRDHALDPRYWQPVSAQHKPDQAVLSVLIYRRVMAGLLTLNRGAVDISCAGPVRWLTTRNKVSPGLPRWADPFARAWYSVYKTADQLAIGLRRYKQTRINGWHRWPKEHYRVFVGRAGSAPLTEITAPTGSYYADPFLCTHEGGAWLLAEEFRYSENAGRLVALPLDDPSRGQPLDLPAGHLSFPFVFEHAGERLLLPESSQRRTVDLFSCEEFPARWRLRRRLLCDVDAADSALLQHEGRWWLFTSLRSAASSANRSLAIYFTDDLLKGVWHPHPVNAEFRFAKDAHSYGRCAGPLFRLASGEWVRPIHASRRYYGERVELMRMEELNTERYRESPLKTGPLADLCSRAALHHLCVRGDRIACDVRDRVSYSQHLPLFRRLTALPQALPEEFHRPSK
jgi:hypothetical protein